MPDYWSYHGYRRGRPDRDELAGRFVELADGNDPPGRIRALVIDDLDLDRLRIRFQSGAELIIPRTQCTTVHDPEEVPNGKRRPDDARQLW